MNLTFMEQTLCMANRIIGFKLFNGDKMDRGTCIEHVASDKKKNNDYRLKV